MYEKNEALQSAHAQSIRLKGICEVSEKNGFIILKTKKVRGFYEFLKKEVYSYLEAQMGKEEAVHIVYLYLPPRVSEMLAEEDVSIFRAQKKKPKRPEVTTSPDECVVLLRQYVIQN